MSLRTTVPCNECNAIQTTVHNVEEVYDPDSAFYPAFEITFKCVNKNCKAERKLYYKYGGW